MCIYYITLQVAYLQLLLSLPLNAVLLFFFAWHCPLRIKKCFIFQYLKAVWPCLYSFYNPEMQNLLKCLQGTLSFIKLDLVSGLGSFSATDEGREMYFLEEAYVLPCSYCVFQLFVVGLCQRQNLELGGHCYSAAWSYLPSQSGVLNRHVSYALNSNRLKYLFLEHFNSFSKVVFFVKFQLGNCCGRGVEVKRYKKYIFFFFHNQSRLLLITE